MGTVFPRLVKYHGYGLFHRVKYYINTYKMYTFRDFYNDDDNDARGQWCWGASDGEIDHGMPVVGTL